MRITSRWALTLATLTISTTLGVVWAQEGDSKKETAKQAAGDKAAAKEGDSEAKTPADPYAVPKDAKPDELIAFIKKILRRPNVKTQEEFEAALKKIAAATLEASKLALDSKEIEEDDAVSALEFQFVALQIQRQLEIEGASKLELELAEKYKGDSRAKLAKMAKEKLLFARLANIKELKEDEQKQLIEDAIGTVKGDGKLTRQSIQVAMMVGRQLEQTGNDAFAATVYEKFAEVFKDAEDKSVSQVAVKLEGTARRLRLPGSKLEIAGELVEGKPFDLAAYEGKVVLVDFWATWCGPCIAELPNVKQNYNAYKSKGFDVVGISLDDNQGKLESFIKKNKIKWANLFSRDENATGWEHPMAVKYGVMGIPFTILIGKDGKVISTNVRGPKLGKALLEQLGEPDEAALKAAIEEEAKENAENDEDTKKSEKKEE